MKLTLRERVDSSYRKGHQHDTGTEVNLVEPLDPERRYWTVEVRVPDDTLEGGAWFETLEVEVTQLDFRAELEDDMAVADQALVPEPYGVDSDET